MLKILIYNSDRGVAASVGTATKSFLRKARCSFELSTYHSIEKAKQIVEDDAFFYDILLLDAEDNASFPLAQTVRKGNLQASIILMAEAPIDIPALLQYRPSGLIRNTNAPENIFESFRTAYREQLCITSYFTIKNRESVLKIFYRDILYFESNQRVVTLHTLKGKKNYSFYAKLDDIYEKLPKNLFVRCHKSYIVNMSAIERLDKVSKRFTLHTGHDIDISKRSYADVAALYETYEYVIM